ncbi:MAG: c-type cytochrome [Actinobacteria bacterium]|nr:c-type cytochrome [Actinomycetota bacterium]
MKTLARKRRHPAALVVLLLLGLLVTGGAYAVTNSLTEAKSAEQDQALIDEGRQLFLEGCSSCHGNQGTGTETGPSLIGVGAANVHFQMATGRMPLAGPAVQAPSKTPEYDEQQIAAIASYIASLAPGPAIPSAADLNTSEADAAEGGELFRANCAQCHQASFQGGALNDGRHAPNLTPVSDQLIFEAMLSGPQNMPVFSDSSLPVEDKQAIIAYINELREAPAPGGWALGSFGPVTEGLFFWTVGIAAAIACAVWIGAKVR